MRSPRHQRRLGLAVIYIMILATVLFGLAALAVDFGYISMVKSELQSAVDASCLAGVSGLAVSPTEARTRAKAIALANKVNGKGFVLKDSDIEFGAWNAATKTMTLLTGTNESKATAIRVNGRLDSSRGSQVNLMFARILGFNEKFLSSSAIAGFSQAADIVIVQDITNSFSLEIADAKSGDQALLDSLNQGGSSGKSKFGLVAFTGWGKTISPLKAITTSYAALTSSISSMNLCGSSGMPACSGTDIASGIEQGLLVFNDPMYPSTSKTGRAMIIVSDGESTQNSGGKHPSLNDTQLLKLAQTDANTAWAQGIHIYVVFFNRDGDPNAAQKLATLVRGKGDFVQVTDPKQLPTALSEITKKLPMSIVR